MSARTSSRSERALPRGPYAVSPRLVAADQRRRLLDAVPGVIAEHGLEATTVAQIVKAARVRRNSFYEQFENKRDCIAAAYEIAQERVLGAITFQCYSRAGLGPRIRGATAAALALLGAEPMTARLLVIEAPVAGVELAERHHAWIDRYSRMLHFASIGEEEEEVAMHSPSIEPAIVGGIFSRVKQVMLSDGAERLPKLAPELATFATSFYGPVEPVAGPYGSEQPQSPVEREAAPAVPA